MAYEFQIFKCPKGCFDTFWTLCEMYRHHFEHHERPLPQALQPGVLSANGTPPEPQEDAAG